MERDFKSGFVAILGRPNVGKSTILNALTGNKISIISPVPQTTRHQIKGILNLEKAQIVFVDTPGIHSFKDNLATQLNTIAKQSVEGCDLILYVVDVTRNLGKEEAQIMDFLTRQKIKIIMVLNKMDLGEHFSGSYIDAWKKHIEAQNIKTDPIISYLPLSAKTGKNMEMLKNVIIDNLPEQEPFYDTHTVTDFPMKFRIADIVREKLFLNLKDELPHSLAVEVQEMKDRQSEKTEEAEEETEKDGASYEDYMSSLAQPNKSGPLTGPMYIKVNIYVNRVSQRKIVIGEKGKLLKEIGIQSRLEMEAILNKRVYLDIRVEVLEDWQNKPRILQELGYWVA
ncbi:MAG: GTPase Era [Candidatus Omnitrophota bacterium]|nr:GTPase Era [Candidatus Omnitrophota bacterium]